MDKTITNNLEFKNGDINGMYDPDEARLNRSIQRYKNNMIYNNENFEIEEDETDTETYRITLTNNITNIEKLKKEEETQNAEIKNI